MRRHPSNDDRKHLVDDGHGPLWRPRRGPYAAASGQSLVEFAFVIPLFIALLFGSIEIGMALKTQAAYQEAVQQATRVAAAAGGAGDADTQALAQLQRILTTENVRNITKITIYKANVDGSPLGNQHTYYIYSPSLKRFVCQNSGQDAPCNACPSGSFSGCSPEAYWDLCWLPSPSALPSRVKGNQAARR